MKLSIKGKEIYLILVQDKECNCKKCICKFQYSCVNCQQCCMKNHLKIYVAPNEPITQEIRTEIFYEFKAPPRPEKIEVIDEYE